MLLRSEAASTNLLSSQVTRFEKLSELARTY